MTTHRAAWRGRPAAQPAHGRQLPAFIGPLVLVIQLCGMQIKTWPPSDFVLVVWLGNRVAMPRGTAGVSLAPLAHCWQRWQPEGGLNRFR